MTNSQFDEHDIRDIVLTIDSLFKYDENDDIYVNRDKLHAGVMVYWGHGISTRTPNFHSDLLKEISSNLYYADMSVISEDDYTTTVLYNECEIEMKLSSTFHGEQTYFTFKIISYPNDTPCVSDAEDDN
jgi:hypothetical protein